MALVTRRPDAWTARVSNKRPDGGANGSDGYPDGGSEPDRREEREGAVVLFPGEPVPCVTGDDCSYITTHEIQLSELSDHEADCEQGPSAGFPAEEDGRLSPPPRARAPFDAAGRGGDPPAASPRRAGVSTLKESDPRDAANFPSSDERASKSPQQCGGNGAGQIHLSIRTASRAINDPSDVRARGNIFHHAARSGDMPRRVLRDAGGKGEASRGGARRKDAPEYSSGTSSAVSELDDADKEVRSLTARAFKSLASPHFDAPKPSASTGSPASEQAVGINRWSTLVDLRYGSVSVSQALDQSIVSHQRSTLEIARSVDNAGYTGTKAPRGAPPLAEKLEPMGDFGPGRGGLIRLTETLNFCCNVKSGMAAGERRTNFAQNAAGSRSPDEVTDGLPGSQKRVTTKQPRRAMEDTHRKAILASSLIKNVISKKMQFEQERKMERGEIGEPQRAPPSCLARPGSGSPRAAGRRELRRQSSRFSESGSEHALVCADETEDVADGGSRDGAGAGGSRGRAPATDAEPEPANGAGIAAKKGAPGASKSTLLLSQNSAFRCWRDGELEFQRDRKSDPTPAGHSHPATEAEGDRRSASDGKPTKMSRLFVPSVQLLSGDGERQLQSGSRSAGGGTKLRSGDAFHVAADSRRAAASKSPGMKMDLRSAGESGGEPAGVSGRLAPSLGCGRTDDFKCQALSAALKGEPCADRAPHFTVRDVRDSKGKLQTPIHQVRDVRKLVKSSYHFVSLDSGDNKHALSCSDGQSEQKRQPTGKQSHSVSPIVIKCQSVNTNSQGKPSGFPKMCCDPDKPAPEGAGGLPPQRSAGSTLLGASEESGGAPGTDGQSVPKRPPDVGEKKPANPAANRLALEKLRAAVKTMERLYVYEKNEWKRKDEPRPPTGSHVPSPIAAERPGGADGAGAARDPRGGGDGRSRPKSAQAAPDPSPGPGSGASGAKALPDSVRPTPLEAKAAVPGSPKAPASLKISRNRNEGAEAKEADRFAGDFSSAPADGGNYLTIPVESSKTSVCSLSTQSPPGPTGTRAQTDSRQAPKLAGFALDAPSPEVASIYHSLPRALSAGQPQFYCFPPAIAADPFHGVQRKVLLDPSTGSYYLVDTPVQPATKRLFDPETGHYVDVPVSQTPVTPLPVSIPHLALSPGPAYMIYPGFMQAPAVIPARTLVQSQLSAQSEVGGGEPGAPQHTEGRYVDSPLYMTTGNSPHAACGAQHLEAGAGPPHGVPSVSITSQQGPRIIAPPSFDGTTMSFVVEHR